MTLGDLKPYMQAQSEILLQDKKTDTVSDWSTLRPDFVERARAGT